MSRRRWGCLRCDRPGLLAPGRMRKDDVRRFCLPCSEETGRLVERTCPALERKREQAAAERKERAAANRQKERERWLLADGTDVRKLLRRARNLPAWRRQSEVAARAVKRVKVDVVVGQPRGSHGRAWRHRVHVHLAKREHPAMAMSLIVHELAHVADFAERGGRARMGKKRRPVHDGFFWSLWQDAMEDVYPALKQRRAELRANRDRLVEDNRAAARDEREAGDEYLARWFTQDNHYALERANAELIRAAHEGLL